MEKHGKKLLAKEIGELGERYVQSLLEREKFSILARNWRPPSGKYRLELDIVALKASELFFVEVKTRTHSIKCDIPPYAAFTQSKKKHILMAAREYLAVYSMWEYHCEFCLYSVILKEDGSFVSVECFENVIDFGEVMGRRHTAWQPW